MFPNKYFLSDANYLDFFWLVSACRKCGCIGIVLRNSKRSDTSLFPDTDLPYSIRYSRVHFELLQVIQLCLFTNKSGTELQFRSSTFGSGTVHHGAPKNTDLIPKESPHLEGQAPDKPNSIWRFPLYQDYQNKCNRFEIINPKICRINREIPFRRKKPLIMAHGAQERVQNAMRDFVNLIDKKHMREVERQVHLCAAECCADKDSSMNDVLACKDRCELPAKKAQHYLQNELERFQEQLNRCLLSCQDDIKDKVSPTTPEADMEKLRHEFDSCAIKCCDTNIAKMPKLSDRVLEAMKSGQL